MIFTPPASPPDEALDLPVKVFPFPATSLSLSLVTLFFPLPAADTRAGQSSQDPSQLSADNRRERWRRQLPTCRARRLVSRAPTACQWSRGPGGANNVSFLLSAELHLDTPKMRGSPFVTSQPLISTDFFCSSPSSHNTIFGVLRAASSVPCLCQSLLRLAFCLLACLPACLASADARSSGSH